jgi:hypothetical protein
MFVIIILLTFFYTSSISCSYRTPIPVRKPLEYKTPMSQTPQTVTTALSQLTIKESLPTAPPAPSIKKPSDLTSATKDSMITDGVYGAGL